MEFKVSHFDLDKIAESGQCFRWVRLSRSKYWIPTGDACAEVTQTGDVLTVNDQGTTPDPDFWANYFAVNDDYAGMWRGIELCAERDGPEAYLTRAARASDGIVILKQPLWETLASFIVSQNNNIPRIKRSVKEICRQFGTPHSAPGGAWYSFPDADTLATADLSEMGLGYRAQYISGIAAAVAEKRFDLEYLQTVGYETARAYLKSVPGIGDKVANCICLFALGHMAAFPVDTWIRRIVNREFGGEFPITRYLGYAGLIGSRASTKSATCETTPGKRGVAVKITTTRTTLILSRAKAQRNGSRSTLRTPQTQNRSSSRLWRKIRTKRAKSVCGLTARFTALSWRRQTAIPPRTIRRDGKW